MMRVRRRDSSIRFRDSTVVRIMRLAVKRQRLRLRNDPAMLSMARWLLAERIRFLFDEAEQRALSEGRRRVTDVDVDHALALHETDESRAAFLRLKFAPQQTEQPTVVNP